MCEIFAFSGPDPTELAGDLRVFYTHSDQNPDGWGLLTYEGGRPVLVKEPCRASDSRIIPGILENMEKDGKKYTLLLSHIRAASVGSLAYDNCHPFGRRTEDGTQWFFMHNGTLKIAPALKKYCAMQRGASDSERAFLYFLDLLEKTGSADAAALQLASELGGANTLNFFLTDGRKLYVHANRPGRLHMRELNGGIEIATFPLSEQDTQGWEEFPLYHFRVYEKGKLLMDKEPVYAESPDGI